MTTPSTSCGAWPCTTRTRSSPGSSTGKADAHPEDCHTPPLESKAYATTGKSTATNQTTNPRKDPYSPWPTTPPNSVSHRPPCTAGWATGSSPANRSPPAPPGASASPTRSAPCSSTTLPKAGYPCWKPPTPSACPARPSCSVSSAASCKPSTSAPDAGKAYASTFPAETAPYFDQDNERKEQCDDASNAPARSASRIHTRVDFPRSVLNSDSIASWQPRPGRNPYDRDSNRASHSGSSAPTVRACNALSAITGIPSPRRFPFALGMNTRLTGLGLHTAAPCWSQAANSAFSPASSTTLPSTPAVLRPAFCSVTRRTLSNAFARERSISFCRLRTFFRSPAWVAVKIRCRSRRTSSSTRRHSTASQSKTSPSGPFTVTVSNLPIGSGVSVHLVSTGSPDPRQRPFRPGLRPYPTSSPGSIRRRCQHSGSRVPAAVSAVGVGFLGHPAPAGELHLPHGRPTGPQRRIRTPSGCYRRDCLGTWGRGTASLIWDGLVGVGRMRESVNKRRTLPM